MSKTHFNFTAKWSFSSNHSFIHFHFCSHMHMPLHVHILSSTEGRSDFFCLLDSQFHGFFALLCSSRFSVLSMTKMTVTISCAYMINADIRNTLHKCTENTKRERSKTERNEKTIEMKRWKKRRVGGQKHLHDQPGSFLSILFHTHQQAIQESMWKGSHFLQMPAYAWVDIFIFSFSNFPTKSIISHKWAAMTILFFPLEIDTELRFHPLKCDRWPVCMYISMCVPILCVFLMLWLTQRWTNKCFIFHLLTPKCHPFLIYTYLCQSVHIHT